MVKRKSRESYPDPFAGLFDAPEADPATQVPLDPLTPREKAEKAASEADRLPVDAVRLNENLPPTPREKAEKAAREAGRVPVDIVNFELRRYFNEHGQSVFSAELLRNGQSLRCIPETRCAYESMEMQTMIKHVALTWARMRQGRK